MNTRKALVIGATGLSGQYTSRHLRKSGWHITGLSRSPLKRDDLDRHVACDLASGEGADRLSALEDVTNVFICTWSKQATETENVRVNKRMLQTLFEKLPAHAPIEHVALVTGLKHYLGPFEAYASGKPYTPFLETQPRLPGENFYYDQEDVVFAAAEKRGFRWTVHRPHTMIGLAIGNAMNMAVTLAVYASICRETGRPFVYPGSQQQYEAATDVTDARILADQLVWAAENDHVRNVPLNIVNGDIFRWTWLWARIAEYFGLEPAEYPGHPTPLEEQMADADQIWAGMVEKHNLHPYPVTKLASWWHSDADLGREMECFTDMTNSRRLGFTGYRSTLESFTDVFDTLREQRIIPS